jgi:ElaB/YqjD/DUF883 family membrane-anchored ribosome-binding protein
MADATMNYEFGMHGETSIDTLVTEVRTEAVTNAGQHAIDNLTEINSTLDSVMEGEAVEAVKTAFKNNAERFKENCETLVKGFESEVRQAGKAYSDLDDGIKAKMENITSS